MIFPRAHRVTTSGASSSAPVKKALRIVAKREVGGGASDIECKDGRGRARLGTEKLWGAGLGPLAGTRRYTEVRGSRTARDVQAGTSATVFMGNSDEAEGRKTLMGAEDFERTAFGTSHEAFLRGDEVIVAGEVEPAMDEVKGELGAEGGGVER